MGLLTLKAFKLYLFSMIRSLLMVENTANLNTISENFQQDKIPGENVSFENLIDTVNLQPAVPLPLILTNLTQLPDYGSYYPENFIVNATISFTNNAADNNTSTTDKLIITTKESFYCSENDSLIYDYETKKCYEKNSKGPCGVKMKFISDLSESNIGTCECEDQMVEMENNCKNSNIFSRPLIYIFGEKRCYYSFHQGPCSTDLHWLVLNEDNLPVCKINPCKKFNKSSTHVDSYLFYDNGGCHETKTQGYCEENNILEVSSYSWIPICTPLQIIKNNTDELHIQSNESDKTSRCEIKENFKCSLGSRQNRLGNCKVENMN